jgi:hypothetical protein
MLLIVEPERSIRGEKERQEVGNDFDSRTSAFSSTSPHGKILG